MKIFVTGGTGFLGSKFLSHSINNGHEVTAIFRTLKVSKTNLCSKSKWLNKSMDQLTISDLVGHDALVHFASAGVSPKHASWTELMYVNVYCQISMLESAYKAGIKNVIFIGSFSEYGTSANHYEYIPVEAPLKPNTPYSMSKAIGGSAAIEFAKKKDLNFSYLIKKHIVFVFCIQSHI
jgi:nucleoside-diphosphate-sugar epimerase